MADLPGQRCRWRRLQQPSGLSAKLFPRTARSDAYGRCRPTDFLVDFGSAFPLGFLRATLRTLRRRPMHGNPAGSGGVCLHFELAGPCVGGGARDGLVWTAPGQKPSRREVRLLAGERSCCSRVTRNSCTSVDLPLPNVRPQVSLLLVRLLWSCLELHFEPPRTSNLEPRTPARPGQHLARGDCLDLPHGSRHCRQRLPAGTSRPVDQRLSWTDRFHDRR